MIRGKVMADLYLETTIIFADIVGFTAWSSVRSPEQVFQRKYSWKFCLSYSNRLCIGILRYSLAFLIVLETLYSQFDAIAKRRRIFKGTLEEMYLFVAIAKLTLFRSAYSRNCGRLLRGGCRCARLPQGPCCRYGAICEGYSCQNE